MGEDPGRTPRGAEERRPPVPGLLGLPGHLWRQLPRRARVPFAVTLVVLAGGAVWSLAVAAPGRREARDAREAAAERRAEAAGARRRAVLARAAQPRRGAGPAEDRRAGEAERRRVRAALVARLERAVAADGRRRARAGEVRGAFREATCRRSPATIDAPAPQDDLALEAATLSCLAVASRASGTREAPGATLGQPYRARIRFARGSFAFCRIVGMPGELSVRAERDLVIPPACGGP